MNKKERLALAKVADFHFKEWQRLHNPDDCWHNRVAKQAHFDALQALFYNKLIDDFNFSGTVVIQGITFKGGTQCQNTLPTI